MDQILRIIVHRTRQSLDILQAKDSHSEWGDGKFSISEFLGVSRGGNQYELFVYQKALRIKEKIKRPRNWLRLRWLFFHFKTN